MVDFTTKKENAKCIWNILCHKLKECSEPGVMSTRHRRKLEGASAGQIGDNLSIKMNKDRNTGANKCVPWEGKIFMVGCH